MCLIAGGIWDPPLTQTSSGKSDCSSSWRKVLSNSYFTVKDPPRFLNMFKHGKVCVWIHACLIPDNSPLFSAEHITSDTAFAGCPLLPFEIADVLLFPLSFWKGESKMFHCMFPRESGSRFNIYEISQSLLDFLSFSKAVQPTANLWSMAGCRIKDQCI